MSSSEAPCVYSTVAPSAGSGWYMLMTTAWFRDGTYNHPESGSMAAPPQVAAPPSGGRIRVPCHPPATGREIGVKSGPNLNGLTASIAIWRISGVKSTRSSIVTPWYSNGAGFVGNGWVGETYSPGMLVSVGTGRSSIGQTGSPVTRSNVYTNPCLLTCTSALMSRPSTVISTRLGDVGKS